jgi:hypothetical protein
MARRGRTAIHPSIEAAVSSVSGGAAMIGSTARGTPTAALAPDAVVWIDERHAIVARAETEGIATTEIRRVGQAESRYLARVVHEVGDRQHVMIVGAQPMKLALEREYVAISHRPDHLVAAPPAARGAGAEILDRFERLAA